MMMMMIATNQCNNLHNPKGRTKTTQKFNQPFSTNHIKDFNKNITEMRGKHTCFSSYCALVLIVAQAINIYSNQAT